MKRSDLRTHLQTKALALAVSGHALLGFWPKELDGTMADLRTAISKFLRNVAYAISDSFSSVEAVRDHDARVREEGKRTIGTILDIQRRRVSVDSGAEKYYVSYEFEIGGQRLQRRNLVRRIRRLKRGDVIIVYYTPGSRSPDSAIDWKPRRATREEIGELHSI